MALADKEIMAQMDTPDPKPTKSPNQIKKGGGPAKPVLKNTADERKCVSPCSKDPMPPSPKAPEAPEQAKIGQPPQGDKAD